MQYLDLKKVSLWILRTSVFKIFYFVDSNKPVFSGVSFLQHIQLEFLQAKKKKKQQQQIDLYKSWSFMVVTDSYTLGAVLYYSPVMYKICLHDWLHVA